MDWTMQETGYGSFRRTLTLNVPVNADKANARFENGRLMLHLPKVEEAQAKRIQVHAK
jgi:HSP20 family protein